MDTPIFDQLVLEYQGEGWMDSTWIKAEATPYISPISYITKMAPGIEDIDVPCPACVDSLTHTPTNILIMIVMLNDDHHWTREQIADWLDSLDEDLTLQKIGEEEK